MISAPSRMMEFTTRTPFPIFTPDPIIAFGPILGQISEYLYLGCGIDFSWWVDKNFALYPFVVLEDGVIDFFIIFKIESCSVQDKAKGYWRCLWLRCIFNLSPKVCLCLLIHVENEDLFLASQRHQYVLLDTETVELWIVRLEDFLP